MTTTTAPSTTAAFPPVVELSPADAREVLRQVQASVPVELPLAQIDDRVIPGGPTGEVSIRIVRPANKIRIASDWLLDAVLPRQAVQLGLLEEPPRVPSELQHPGQPH